MCHCVVDGDAGGECEACIQTGETITKMRGYEGRTFVHFHAFHGLVVNGPSALFNKLIAFDA